jgi:hypothetical protein
MDWADGDMDLVKQCAQTVLRVAKQILTDLTPGRADLDAGDPQTGDLDTGELAGPVEPLAGLAVAVS